ncbi:MAG: hypothetical protein ISF22_07255 [Methanomassiliicoccus sp.]|nr:hypothetical protein [Methanomassiliicoccus sp.]
MSERTVLQKLHLKPGQRLYLSSPPEHFLGSLTDLPEGALTEEPGEASIILLFVRDRTELESAVPAAVGRMTKGAALWVAYPKSSSRPATDINRDSIWSWARKWGMDAVASFSIDQRWSALRIKVP